MNLETPRIVDGRAMLIAGFEQQFPCDNPRGIPELWNRFAPHIGRIPGQVGGICYGACYDVDGKNFQYLAAVEVASADGLPEGFTVKQVPAQRYAVFAHHEHVSKLKEAMDAIWSRWLPESGHKVVDSAIVLERYGERFDPQAGKGDIEVWLPIKS